MRQCYTVFKHEIRKLLSDKKTLSSMFLLPVMTVFMLAFISLATNEETPSTYRVYILDNAMKQTTLEYASGEQIDIIPINYNTYDEAVNHFEITQEDVILDINGNNANIYYDSSNVISNTMSNFCEQYINAAYNTTFISTNKISVLDMEMRDYAKAGSNTMIALFLPYMLILLLFTNVSNYTCDTIAGEKERGVFSKTLLTPISASSIITGKSLSSAVCGLFSTLIYTIIIAVGSLLINHFVGIDIFGFDGIQLSLGEIVLLSLYAIMLCLLLSNLAVLCSLFAKTAKEARSLLIPFMGVTILLSLLSIMRVGTIPAYRYLIPIYNLCITIQDILMGNTVMLNMLIAAGSLLFLALIVFIITLHSFKNESIRY